MPGYSSFMIFTPSTGERRGDPVEPSRLHGSNGMGAQIIGRSRTSPAKCAFEPPLSEEEP